jgi:succinyl-diaminopimelate desuccinylase
MITREAFTQQYEEKVVSLLQDMIQINTMNHVGSELDLALFIQDYLNGAGLASEIQQIGETGANLISRLEGGNGRKAMLFNGHLDTVPVGEIQWEHGVLSGKRIGDSIYGRGASDMKGGLASMLVAIEALKETEEKLSGDLVFLATAGEEIDSIGAKTFMDSVGLHDVESIVIGEPTSCDIVTTEKGALWLEVSVSGKNSHGAFPEKGINAIKNMCKFINVLEGYEFQEEHHDILGKPTMNLSTIQGGKQTNLVPDYCTLTVDIRTVPPMQNSDVLGDIKDIIEGLNKEGGGFEAKYRILNDRVSFETQENHPLIELAKDIQVEHFQKDPSVGGVNFYTDGTVFVPPTNLPCLIFGPGDSNVAHQPNEMVRISDLVDAAYFYYLLALKKLN